INDKFHRIKQHTPDYELSEDFDARVFAKIKKKKTQRKVVTSTVLGVLLFGFLFIAQSLFYEREPADDMMAARSDRAIEQKEEVPVMEDVIFASSDAQTNYAIDQVGYNESDDSSI
ncbi:MAG: hypothetical protein GY757_13185, partial [bacterium]|nr:hypothetical protein [bacterium]